MKIGRYIEGDFEWKFAFADQGSTFGEVLEIICSELKECSLNRYIGTQGEGEKVELHVEDKKELLKACKKFVGKDFKLNTEELIENKLGNDYWDKVMIRKFIKKRNEFKDDEGDTLYFDVEY